MDLANKLHQQAEQRILIILPRQIGDVILATTFIPVLRKAFPNLRLGWVAHPMVADVLEGQPGLDAVFYLPQGRRSYKPRTSGFRGRIEAAFGQTRAEFKLIQEVRTFRPDVVIDAINNPRTALLAALSSACARLSFRTRFPRNLAFTHLIDRSELGKGYLGLSRLALLKPLGIAACDANVVPPITIPRPKAACEKIDALFASDFPQLKQKPFITLCPPHRHDVRRWTESGFLEVARHITQKWGVPVVWLWGPGEETLVRGLHEQLTTELAASNLSATLSCFVPLLNLRETSELCSRSLCWVGNCSGLSHLAVASGCKTVRIHGPTAPKSWLHPDSSRHRAAVRKSGCVGCEQNACTQPRRECLDDLPSSVVIAELESLLGNELSAYQQRRI